MFIYNGCKYSCNGLCRFTLINFMFIYQYLFCFSTCLLPLIIRKRVFRLLCSWTFQVEHQQQAGESFLKEGDGLQNRLNPNVGGGGYVVFLVTSIVHFHFWINYLLIYHLSLHSLKSAPPPPRCYQPEQVYYEYISHWYMKNRNHYYLRWRLI